MTYQVDNYIQGLQQRVAQQSHKLIAQFEYLKTLHFADEVDHLQIISSLGEEEIAFTLFSMEDLFTEAYAEDDANGFATSLDFIEEFTFDVHDSSDESEAFYEDNDLERASIHVLGDWVRTCFEKADGQAIPLPVYFGIHDDIEMLDLKSGKWFNPDDMS